MSPDGLQEVLGNTLVAGEISLIYGNERSLLTLLSHFLCINVCTSGHVVSYLDSGRNFSPAIIKNMSSGLSTRDSNEVLSRISVGHLYHLDDIENVVVQLTEGNTPSLVVLDNLTALLNLSTSPGSKERYRRLFSALEAMRRLVNRKRIHALITDHSTTDWRSGSFRPIGGNVVSHAVDSLLFLRKLETEDHVSIKVDHSPHVSLPAGLVVRINHKGVFSLEG